MTSQPDMKALFRTIVSAHSPVITLLLLMLLAPRCVSAQDARGTVNTDSLQVYREMSIQSEVVSVLTRGAVVGVNLSITNAEGSWCSVSSVDPPAKLGFVHCNGLQRQAAAATAASPDIPLLQGSGSSSHLLNRAQKEWGLAASALLTELNREHHDTLAGVTITEERKIHNRQRMETWWGIQSRQDLLNTLAWLDETGHRRMFAALGERVSQMEPEEFDKLLTHADAENANSLRIARRYYRKLGEQSLVAWDYARYISLCREGYSVGYLSEDEAWQRIIYAARILQRTFGSWQELGENYLIGREFWSLAQTQKDGEAMRTIYSRLLSNSNSPWNRIPWALDLE
jgi:hypothetical protein